MKVENMAVRDAPGLMPRIESVWAFLSVDVDGNEGVIGGPIGPDRGMIPFIGADEARVKSLLPMVEHIVKLTGRPARLVKFSVREDVREIVVGGRQ